MDKEPGVAFPLKVEPSTGRIKHVENQDTIRQSLKLILSTKKGERFLYPDFGCNLYKFMFSPINYTTLKQIEQEAISAITKWEDRIEDIEVRVEPDNDFTNVNIHVRYTWIGREFEYDHRFERE